VSARDAAGPGPEVVELAALDAAAFGDFSQKVLFSPRARGEGFIKLAVTTGRKGARSTAHAHPRDEVTLTLRGEAVLRAGGREYRLREGSAVRLPPGVEHTVEVISDEWVVVAAYCDECALCRPDVAIPPRSITTDARGDGGMARAGSAEVGRAEVSGAGFKEGARDVGRR
jgi:quercetin dioxygenase-like cupin family protein